MSDTSTNTIEKSLTGWRYHLQDGGFLRHVATLSSGSAVGNVILLATAPIISRIYLPDAFGVFSVFLSIFTIGSVFATMNLQVALPLPRRFGTAANLLFGSFGVLGSFTVLSIVTVHIADIYADRIPVYDQIQVYSAWLPIAIAGAGANVILYYWLLRRRDYTTLAIVKVGQNSSMVATQIAFGVFGGSALGLIVGHTFGQIVGAVAFAIRIINRDSQITRYVSKSRIRQVLGNYRDFSMQYTPGVFVSMLTLMLPAIFLTAMHGVAIAGLYAFTTRAIRGGLALIVQSVTRVAYIRCVELRKSNDYRGLLNFYLKLCIRLAFIGIIPFAILFIFGEEMFSFVFGKNWSQAGILATYLVPGLYSFMVLDQSLNIFVIMRKQYAKFVWELFRLILMISVFAIAYSLSLETMTLILWLSIAQAATYVVVFVQCIYIVKGARDDFEVSEII